MGVKIIACFETLTSESEFNESQTEIIEEVVQIQLESAQMFHGSAPDFPRGIWLDGGNYSKWKLFDQFISTCWIKYDPPK